jgi:hypothetical protein
MLNRRSFFVAMLAPLLAPLALVPKPEYDTVLIFHIDADADSLPKAVQRELWKEYKRQN